MAKVDFRNIQYFDMYNIHENICMVTPLRLDRSTVPEGFYCYSIRHDDEGKGDMVTVERGVLVNHHSDVITNVPFDKVTIDNKEYSIDDYIPIEEGDNAIFMKEVTFDDYKAYVGLKNNLKLADNTSEKIVFLIKLGVAIRNKRKELGLSVAEAAKKCETTSSRFANIENGKTVVSLYLFYDITRKLGISVDELFDKVEMMK